MKTRTTLSGALTQEVTLYLGSYERAIHSTAPNNNSPPSEIKRVHRHNLGDLIYTRTITPTTGEQVRLTTKLDDHLGSTDVLLVELWSVESGKTEYAFNHEKTEYQSYDPWGERANVATATAFRQNDSDPFRRSAQDYDRGYTGHEMLDDSGLIHMNGRLYDAELGRMLSPDPYVQVPEYSQNFNRYSYVLNNPLNKTDPTGYSWLSKAFHKIGSWVKENWRTVVAIVFVAILTFVFMPGLAFMGFNSLGLMAGYSGAQISATIGAISGAFNSAINGGNFSDILKGAVIGGVAGFITGGTLHGYEESAAAANGIDKAVAIGKHVVGHGVVGGASNEAMGGKFQDGFLSGAASAAAVHSGLTSKYAKYGSAIGAARRTAVAAIIGGTASALGGGKFANGAYTSAFQHLLNHEHETLKKLGGPIRGYFDRKNGIIGLRNTETGNSIVRDGFLSGAREGYVNNPEMQHIKSPDGKSGPASPLPAGEYRILYRPGAKGSGVWEKFSNIYKSTGEPGYRLEALDNSPNDDEVYAGKGIIRYAFRLHKNYGIGCITCPTKNYRDIAIFIESSGRKNGSYGYINVE